MYLFLMEDSFPILFLLKENEIRIEKCTYKLKFIYIYYQEDLPCI